MFRCLKPGCPVDCGTRTHPTCADRVLCHALFLVLAAVLVLSLAIGLSRMVEAARSTFVSEPSPVTRAE